MLDFFRMMLLNKLFYVFKKKKPTNQTQNIGQYGVWYLSVSENCGYIFLFS